MNNFTAAAISRTLKEDLSQNPFSGTVWAVFRSACNLVDQAGRVVSLAMPALGKGPFTVVLDSSSDLEKLRVGERVWIDPDNIEFENTRISLTGIEVWEPQLPYLLPYDRPLPRPVASLLRPYCGWPHLNQTSSDPFAAQLIRASRTLQGALQGGSRIDSAAASLVGFGQGLTPSGDDYLLGVMAALWFVRCTTLLPELVPARRSTTFLSLAFLSAAGGGYFSEPWHQLGAAISGARPAPVLRAIQRIVGIGASSGRDALTGFASTLLTMGYLAH